MEETFKKLRLKEYNNKKYFQENPDNTLPYPHLDDPQFQKKISFKKEFSTYQYDGTIADIKIKAAKVCRRDTEFEISPHQEFIKRFISYQTPYNGVLLFHGLGSGKTCSAIGITETIRTYSKYIPNFKKILIIASPNVQDNFRLQLFNPSKLQKINNSWNITGCLGNSFIQELNVYQINNLSKEDLIAKIDKIINTYYDFTGYIEFANRVEKCMVIRGGVNPQLTERKLKLEFEGSLIIIDEIHNIRLSGNTESSDKKAAKSLFTLVQYVKYLKLVFLTGTPMYNDPKEILFILNILNLNDNRSIVGPREIFDENNEFKVDSEGKEVGKELFMMKSNGYVSYVRGENPYAFPFSVSPNLYSDPHSIKRIEYPRRQFNSKAITNPIKYLDLYLSKLSDTQEEAYLHFLNNLTKKFSEEQIAHFEEMESFRYTEIMTPIQSLNIVYPIGDKIYTGNTGLSHVMSCIEKQNPPSKNNYEYIQMDGMFTYDKIGEYSSKIKSILDHIINSTGIILIYSQYIDGGLIPMALALEELGFQRYKSKNLFKKRRPPLSIHDLKREGLDVPMKQACYSIICGEKMISPNTNEEIEALTNNNTNGERVKVVMISQAGSEGLDFKNLRQVHIMEPWYNMNRIEQIIGRARRNCSHVELPLEQRNVQVFLHATLLENGIESMDMYLYRLSEKKSIQIGKVSRILKSVAIDCILNKQQQLFARMTQKLKIQLSESIDGDPIKINYSIKDEPYTSLCDYTDKCEFQCVNVLGNDRPNISTYEYSSTKSNKVMDKIKELFKKRHVYKKNDLVQLILKKGIQLEEIYRALKDLEVETLVDKYGRKGNLIHMMDIYFFQPIEIKDPHVSMTERINPIQSKLSEFSLEMERPEIESIEPINSVVQQLKDTHIRAWQDHPHKKTDADWYMYFSSAATELMRFGLTKEQLNKYLIEHMCDQLTLEEDLAVLNYIFSVEEDFADDLQGYYYYSSVTNEGIVGQLLIDPTSKEPEKLYVMKSDVWLPATYTDKNKLDSIIKKKFVKPKGAFFQIVGFMGKSKSMNGYEFKVKESDTKFIGAVFENKLKNKMIEIINTTLEEDTYNKANTSSFNKNELCIIEELLLRHYDEIKKNNKRYFLNKIEYYQLNKN